MTSGADQSDAVPNMRGIRSEAASGESFHERFDENLKMQKLGSNDVRLTRNLDIFEALDELYPMGVVPGVFGSNSGRLRSYRYEKKPLKEL